MNDAAWDRIVDALDANYGLVKHGRDTREVADATQFTEQVAFVIFDRQGERYRLERITGPAIIDRRIIGARRAGATQHSENVYDPTETANRIQLLREDGDDWVATDPASLGL